ncbi:RHS repeat-associated core domain-containing protein [Agarivorans sp. QJM3NY_33]|uniref:RHS repeat-associated core domain-containing protein n=1 Tax=unclassified Agarivorans TaxID=2636026 RepID=UPI003F6D38A0
MLNEVGIIHMNGRIYDQASGRFLQADFYIPHPTQPTSFNRYVYAMNNPLNVIDPNGYWDTWNDTGHNGDPDGPHASGNDGWKGDPYYSDTYKDKFGPVVNTQPDGTYTNNVTTFDAGTMTVVNELGEFTKHDITGFEIDRKLNRSSCSGRPCGNRGERRGVKIGLTFNYTNPMIVGAATVNSIVAKEPLYPGGYTLSLMQNPDTTEGYLAFGPDYAFGISAVKAVSLDVMYADADPDTEATLALGVGVKAHFQNDKLVGVSLVAGYGLSKVSKALTGQSKSTSMEVGVSPEMGRYEWGS